MTLFPLCNVPFCPTDKDILTKASEGNVLGEWIVRTNDDHGQVVQLDFRPHIVALLKLKYKRLACLEFVIATTLLQNFNCEVCEVIFSKGMLIFTFMQYLQKCSFSNKFKQREQAA